MQALQPMHFLSVTSTIPPSTMWLAPVGQQRTQGALSQWLHRSDLNSRSRSGYFPFTCLHDPVAAIPVRNIIFCLTSYHTIAASDTFLCINCHCISHALTSFPFFSGSSFKNVTKFPRIPVPPITGSTATWVDQLFIAGTTSISPGQFFVGMPESMHHVNRIPAYPLCYPNSNREISNTSSWFFNHTFWPFLCPIY